MNLFQLVFKQMRQRALSTWLTLLSVLLGVGLAVAIVILQRESAALFGQSDFGYDIILGPATGSPLQLTLNTVYHLDQSPGNVPYALYQDFLRKDADPKTGREGMAAMAKHAIPFMVGDSYNGRRLVGTSPQMFGFDDQGKPIPEPFEYRKDKRYEFAEGRVFAPRKFEAVIGSDVAATLGLKLGSKFRATHGMPAPDDKNADVHKPQWTVVGILKPTHTANDRVLFLPVVSLFAIEEHDVGLIAQLMLKAKFDYQKAKPDEIRAFLTKNNFNPDDLAPDIKRRFRIGDVPAVGTELIKDVAPPKAEEKHEGHDHDHEDEPDAYKLDANGDIVPELPPEAWQLSAILIKSRAPIYASTLMYKYKVISNEAVAVNPATVMRDFFNTFLRPSTDVINIIAWLVIVVAGVGILVSIYNSVSARMREIAILRALGATRARVLTMICLEAALVGLIGSTLGLIVGHLAGAVESFYFNKTLGQSIQWFAVSPKELAALGVAVAIAALAGLVPAMKAYRSPVAENLTTG